MVVGRVVLHAVGDGEQMGEHHLRHRRRAVGGDVGHHNAQLPGRVDVDHVVARGKHAHILQPGQRTQGGAVEHGLVGEHCVGTRGAGKHIGGSRTGIHCEGAERFNLAPRKVAGVHPVAVKHYYLHILRQVFAANLAKFST